ncbi:MAG: shikimate dehydrogenase [Immundisolibacterales bacterium]|nr:shikimate dehydrogenase [Immundisolibacterales bacterium]
MKQPLDRYAVTGHPIGHSKSPYIHRWFAAETGQGIRYDAIPSARDGFEEVVRRFRADGGLGLNVTLPFKEEACALADVRTPRAELAGAANTLSFLPDGTVHGDNTDGVGLIRDLRINHGVALAGRRILMIGAGGAARGVLPALVDERPRRLTVVNRSPERAVSLAARFPAAGVVGCGFGDLRRGDGEVFDIVINATSAGLSGESAPPVPISAFRPGGAAYDMVYATEPTSFLLWSRAAGASLAVDGAGMLVEQGAESFRLWRGVRPPTRRVIAALRAELVRGG